MWELIDQLVQQGVNDFFVGSGSRSTPLVLAAARHPRARLHRHFDERALGFYALGHALGRGQVAAVITTSGTAAGNLLPAVMEAHHSSLPLIIVTADRPAALRETSANQTCDQLKMFQNFVRWQFEFDEKMEARALRSHAAAAVHRARFPHPGPVHLNCPLSEPLYRPPSSSVEGQPILLAHETGGLSEPIEITGRGILLMGRLPSLDDVRAALALGKRLGWPIFADLLSQGRLFPSEEQIAHYDWLFTNPPGRPEVVLHVGERLLSKRLMEWLAAAPPADYIHLSPHPFWNDPYHLVTRRISGNVSSLRIDVRGNKDAAWLAAWRTADQRAAATLMSRFRGEAIPNVTQKLVLDRSESEAFYHASKADVARWAFFFAASMPVREADWFLFPRACRGFYSNRGLSGIDGCIATAVGLAEGLASPVIAWVGDLAALHDLNALSLVRQSPHPICLIISNNGGGGIFSHLPVAADPLAEQWIAFEHQHSFQAAAALFDIPYRRTDDPTSLFAPLEEKTQLIEFVNHRSLNYEFHKALKTCFTGRV